MYIYDNVFPQCTQITEGFVIKDLIAKYDHDQLLKSIEQRVINNIAAATLGIECRSDRCEITWRPTKGA